MRFWPVPEKAQNTLISSILYELNRGMTANSEAHIAMPKDVYDSLFAWNKDRLETVVEETAESKGLAAFMGEYEDIFFIVWTSLYDTNPPPAFEELYKFEKTKLDTRLQERLRDND